MKFILLVGVVILAGPCSSDKTANNENADEATIANTDTKAEKKKAAKKEKAKDNFSGLKLHPLKAACVDYSMSGKLANGTSTKCHRKYAQEQVDIQHTKVGFGGFTQEQNTHNIIIKDIIYSIDLDKGTAKRTTNSNYDELAASMKGKNAKDTSEAFLAALDYTPTGETKTIAGHKCNVYSGPIGNGCFMPNGLMLEQSVMGTTILATKVTLNNGGDNSNYTLYKKYDVTEGPDVGAILDMMGKQ